MSGKWYKYAEIIGNFIRVIYGVVVMVSLHVVRHRLLSYFIFSIQKNDYYEGFSFKLRVVYVLNDKKIQ
ncbi:hypothetical protein HMPREF3232_00805 [Fannyhessea vaginae]|nr:hypothetical protein HMPREF3232_00805 [Fannyhessea vaginae]